MASTSDKRALLIGSPFGDLQGTANDVKTMIKVLRSCHFDVDDKTMVRILTGTDATREKIMDGWQQLISQISPNDAVVIYYSGHGGLVEPEQGKQTADLNNIQFIVPIDFDPNLQSWRGISDNELSILLRRTTDKTRNVTYILDCCHSARLGRRVLDGFSVQPKALTIKRSLYPNLVKLLDQSWQDMPPDNSEPSGALEDRHIGHHVDVNPHVVRIAAAADNETAWEHKVDGQSSMGLLTKNLAAAVMDAPDTSWRNIMLEVGALVKRDYLEGRQHPRSAGPDSRRPFSTTTTTTGAFLATISSNEDTEIRIQGGRTHGIRVDDRFSIIPFRAKEGGLSERPIAVVTDVLAFCALLRAESELPDSLSRDETNCLAVPYETQFQWPIAYPGNSDNVVELLNSSQCLRRCAEDESWMAKIESSGGRLVLKSQQGWQLLSVEFDESQSHDSISRIIEAAKIFCQAEDLLSLSSGSDETEEAFESNVDIVVGSELAGTKNQLFACNASGTEPSSAGSSFTIVEDSRLYITLKNTSRVNVYVNVFSVAATGKICLLSRAWERGLRLSPTHSRTLARKTFPMEGIPVRWPSEVPKENDLEETTVLEESLVFIITSEEVELRNLETATMTGHVSREFDGAAVRDDCRVPYEVKRVRYSLTSNASHV